MDGIEEYHDLIRYPSNWKKQLDKLEYWDNTADNITVTKSNISWISKNIELYPESNGSVSGILGRYSGELVLNFKREDSHKTNSLIFNCRKFAFKDRKF